MLLALSIQAFTSCFQPGICLNNSQLNQYCTFFFNGCEDQGIMDIISFRDKHRLVGTGWMIRES